MDFEFTITEVITVEKTDFDEMKDLVRNGDTLEDAFEKVSARWEDNEYYYRNYIKQDVIDELKRRLR